MELKRRASDSGEKPALAPKRRKCDHTEQHAIALAPTERNSSDKQGILLEEGLLSLEETPKDLLIIAQKNSKFSPLLRLPPELRNQIWGHVLEVPAICLAGKMGRKVPGKRSVVYHMEPVEDENGKWRTKSPLRLSFHLNQVCRQIYAETRTQGFASNTFILHGGNLDTFAEHLDAFPALKVAVRNIEPEYNILRRFFQDTVDDRDSTGQPGQEEEDRSHSVLKSYIATGSLLDRFPGLQTIHISQNALRFWINRYNRLSNEARDVAFYKMQIEGRIKEREGSRGKELKIVFQKAPSGRQVPPKSGRGD